MSGVLPTAAHVALLRRLEEWHLGEPLDARLADLVLTTPAAGRGQPEPGRGRLGAPDQELEDLPARELLRVAVPALATVAAAAGAARAAKGQRKPRVQRVVGSSSQADAVRAALPPPRRLARRPAVLVVGGPLDAMFGGLWCERVRAGSGLRWRRVWSRAKARAALPLPVDLAQVVAGQVAAVGGSRVHLVLAGTPEEAVGLAARALGVSSGPVRADVARSPVATDLIRRVNQVIAMRMAATQRAQVRAVLDELVGRGAPGITAGITSGPGSGDWPEVLAVPHAHRSWAMQQASHLATALRGAACVVHGDPSVVVPSTREKRPSSVTPEQTLRVAGEALWGLVAVIDAEGDPWRTG